MSEASAHSKRESVAAIVSSVALHGLVAGAIFFGWWRLQHQPKPPQPTLAIEATIVDSRTLAPPKQTREPVKPAPVEEPPPEPEATPPPVEPPKPTPEELAQKQQQEDAQREDMERQAAEAKAREQQSQREAEERQQEDANRADQQRKETEAKRQAEAKRAAEAKRQADEKHAAEEKQRLAEEKQRVADEKRKADEARLRAQSESELQQKLKDEERATALRSSGALASWVAAITARIQRAWIRPPSARPGLDCTIEVTQLPGGQVTNVQLGACNGDQAVRESIEAAVYRASPLPSPPDPSLFERELQVRFVPAE